MNVEVNTRSSDYIFSSSRRCVFIRDPSRYLLRCLILNSLRGTALLRLPSKHVYIGRVSYLKVVRIHLEEVLKDSGLMCCECLEEVTCLELYRELLQVLLEAVLHYFHCFVFLGICFINTVREKVFHCPSRYGCQLLELLLLCIQL